MACSNSLSTLLRTLRISSIRPKHSQHATGLQRQPQRRRAGGGNVDHFMKTGSRKPFYGQATTGRPADRRISLLNACEELYNLGENGVRGPSGKIERQVQCVDAAGEIINMGRVYRRAMEKKGVWGEVPREYAGRLVTDWPSRNGWDADWRR
ncbi:MAG: hypothetical protein M1814_001606 [Vezdaea aestivalis]|nr:MAG: hypothetical protein M1814_001606 [Vezdaea aestivalis]